MIENSLYVFILRKTPEFWIFFSLTLCSHYTPNNIATCCETLLQYKMLDEIRA